MSRLEEDLKRLNVS